jgi:hypothetical protein
MAEPSESSQSGGREPTPQANLGQLYRIAGPGSGVGIRIGLRFGRPSGLSIQDDAAPASDRRRPVRPASTLRDASMNRRGTLIAWVAFGLLLPTLGSAQDKSASDEKWVSLFDGKTLGGWTTADGTTGKWTVEDGVIHGSGPASHLFSPRGDYKNFKYRAEVKIADKANSGMYFRTKKGPGFPNGYEAQVNSTGGDPVKTGSLYNHVPVKEMLVPPDTWFTQEIEAVGNHIIIKVNGKTTVDYKDPKNTYKVGHFAFQQHDPGSQVWIRKVEVMELPDSPTTKVSPATATP